MASRHLQSVPMSMTVQEAGRVRARELTVWGVHSAVSLLLLLLPLHIWHRAQKNQSIGYMRWH